MKPYHLVQDDLDGIIAHARREWPREACGLVMKHPRGGRVIHPGRNIAGELHREDPKRWRPATELFVIDPFTVRAALHWLPQGFVFDTLYHSHPSGQAGLSGGDIEMALAAAKEPRMRAMTWLVVGLAERDGRPTTTAWGFDGQAMVERELVLG